MRVFLSVSGNRSVALGTSLQRFMKLVLPEHDTWIYIMNVDPGERWAHSLGRQLQETHCGILCVTPENQGSTWLAFEAGALSKESSAIVIPYCLEMTAEDLPEPYRQFHSVAADKEGTFRLVQTLNSSHGDPQGESALRTRFEAAWPQFETELELIGMHRISAHDLPVSRLIQGSYLPMYITDRNLVIKDCNESLYKFFNVKPC